MRARPVIVVASGRRVSIDLRKAALLALLVLGGIGSVSAFLVFYTPVLHGFSIGRNREASVHKMFQDNYAGFSNALLAPSPRSRSPLPTYRLSVNPEEFAALNHDIVRHAYGEIDRKPRVDGWLTTDEGQVVPVKAVLRGTNVWHHQRWKPSLRIRFPRGHLEGGHRHHILIPPKGPTALRNWLSNDLARRWGMLHVRQEHVRLFINRRYRGLYTRYYRLDESLLLHQGRLPGPFFRLEDNTGAKYQRTSAAFREPDSWEYIDIEPEAGRRAIGTLIEIMSMPPGAEQFDKLDDVVDREAFARYLALRCHGGETHIDSHNVALWLDTSSGKFVPLFADIRGYGWFERPMTRPVLGKNIHLRGDARGVAALEWVWLGDPRNLALYMDRLHELMQGFGSRAEVERIVRDKWAEIRPDAMADVYTSEKGEWAGVGTRTLWPVQWLDDDVDLVVQTIDARMRFVEEELADLTVSVTGVGAHGFEVLVQGLAGAVARGPGGDAVALLPSLSTNAVAERPYAFHELPGRPEDYEFAHRLSGSRVEASPGPRKAEKYRELAGVHAWNLIQPPAPPLVLGPGTVVLRETLDVRPGQAVTIRAGTKLLLDEGVSLRVRGVLQVEGTAEQPVIVRPIDRNRPFGVFALVGVEAAGSRIQWLDIEGGSVDRFLNLDLIGMVSIHDVPGIEIEDSRFGINYDGDDTLHVVRSEAVLRGNLFEGSYADAVDLDRVEGRVVDCIFVDSGNDALDLSMSRVEIAGNRFIRSRDKGVSVGEASYARIERCRFEGNGIGVQVKDSAHAEMTGNVIDGSWIAVHLYEKKWRWGVGGSATLRDTTFLGSVEADVSGNSKSRVRFIGARPESAIVAGNLEVTVESAAGALAR